MAAPTESARARAFESFYTGKAKRQRFSPEFIDSLVQTMRIPSGLICLTEQAWAWTRWRTWGNSSETAMSSWHSSGWELDQVDCAIDLHWFQTGRSLEEIENATRDERREARKLAAVMKRRCSISRAFLKLQAREQVDLSRGRIYSLLSPTFGPQVVEKLTLLSPAREQITKNPHFVSFLTASGADYLIGEQEQKKKELKAVNLLLRSWEKKFHAGESNGGPILISCKDYKENSSSSSEEYVLLERSQTTTTAEDIIPSSGPGEPVSTEVAGNGSLTASASRTTGRGGLPADVTESPAMPSPQPAPEDVSPIVEAVRRHHNVHLSRANAREIVNACREKLRDPSISPEETARFVVMVSPIRSDGTIKNPPGFLRKAVAKEMTTEELRVLRESRMETPPAAITYDGTEEDDPELSSERCYKCGGETIRYASGFVSRCRCQANGQLSP